MLRKLQLVCLVSVLVTLLTPAPGKAASINVRAVGHVQSISAGSVLRATAWAKDARVVAVTFYLDAKALGSDTTAPYAIDLVDIPLKPGPHRLRVSAVDSLGRRASTSARPVTVRRGSPAELVASPTVGLSRALHALAHGARVRLLPGEYHLAQVRLGSGAQLIGAGSKTVIVPPAGPYWSLLIASGSDIRIANLVLDGGGDGGGFGYGVEVQSGSANVRVQRVTMQHVRQAGLHAWGAYSEVSIQDSEITGDGRAHAGVVAGESGSFGKSRDSSVIRCRLTGFTGWGVTFSQATHGLADAALHAVALDNVISEVSDANRSDGTNEGGIWSGGVEAAIVGNKISRTGWDGIETVGSSTNVSVVRNSVTDTPTGIYVEHATTGSLIGNNRISRVATGINVEWWYGGIGSVGNRFVQNRISSFSKAGIFIDVGADRNEVLGNHFSVASRPAIILQGSSKNLVRANRLCGSLSGLIAEQVGRWDNGQVAYPSGNTLLDNTSARTCRAG